MLVELYKYNLALTGSCEGEKWISFTDQLLQRKTATTTTPGCFKEGVVSHVFILWLVFVFLYWDLKQHRGERHFHSEQRYREKVTFPLSSNMTPIHTMLGVPATEL